jgi:hypothetical protein
VIGDRLESDETLQIDQTDSPESRDRPIRCLVTKRQTMETFETLSMIHTHHYSGLRWLNGARIGLGIRSWSPRSMT